MLLAPFVCAAVLARTWHWSVLAALAAVFLAFAAKEPLVVIARQRFRWRTQRPETAAARRWLAIEAAALIVFGVLLALRWPLPALLILGAAAAAFSVLAVVITVRNRQRSALFQMASSIALTSSALAACLSAKGRVENWCWALWGLAAFNAFAGILTVHARLDARAALKKAAAPSTFRTPAIAAQIALIAAAAAACFLRRPWIAAALFISAAANAWDLKQQRNPTALGTPLNRVGLRALALSIVFCTLLTIGLW